MRSPEILVSEEAGVRTLHFGSSWVQGAMRVARPFKLELAYTREMMLPLLLRDWPDGPPRVLVVGLGAGSLVKFLHHHFPGCRLTVVEIEPAVHAAACQHFRFPASSDRLKVVFADAADFVEQTREQFDLVLVDGFDPNARMNRLCTDSFFRACARILVKEGILCINLLSRRKEYSVSRSFIEAAFGHSVWTLPSLDPGNTLVLASQVSLGDSDWIDQILEASVQLRKRTTLDLNPSLQSWRRTASYSA